MILAKENDKDNKEGEKHLKAIEKHLGKVVKDKDAVGKMMKKMPIEKVIALKKAKGGELDEEKVAKALLKHVIKEGAFHVKKKSSLDELDLKTYAKAMNATADYPWVKNISGDNSPKSLGSKQNRVNNLANTRFEQEFYKKYPKDKIEIHTNNGTFVFKNITFTTNHTSYVLDFEKKEEGAFKKRIRIMSSNTGEGYYIEDKGYEITDSKSKSIVLDMLQYNNNAKKN
jgi:hypothetical protein